MPNLAAFQAFASDLTALPHIRNVRTTLTLDLVKDDPRCRSGMRKR